jgi:alkylresorcinol/alkylpyrone synthase
LSKIISVNNVDFPEKISQSDLKDFAKKMFSGRYSDIDRMLDVFSNTNIDYRNLCVPVEYFYKESTFKERNQLYIDISLKYSSESVTALLNELNISKDILTDIIVVSTTGLATPSIDALLINKMKLNPYINRMPLWGLGCAGGVSGIGKAASIARANPKAIILLVAIELCSLTFIRNDYSKSNFIATSLFSDGIASVIITGDDVNLKYSKTDLSIEDSQSRLYYDSLDVMGWEFLNDGFKVVFSRDIPKIVQDCVKSDIEIFLSKNGLDLSDIKNFITHPGGTKVIEAYQNALGINDNSLDKTRLVLRNYGNMSSATVLYVLKEFIKTGFKEGYGLMTSLGPGFSSELALLKMTSAQ